MGQTKRWVFLRSLGLEFWLPLPLIGLTFWAASGVITEYSLKFTDPSVEPFTVTLDQNQPTEKILFIKVRIDRDRGISQVKIKRAAQIYQQQEFELNTTNSEQIETAIGQKIGLSPEKARQLLRYQIKK